MGEIAEIYLEQELDARPRRKRKRVPPGVWIQRDSTPIKVKDMGDRHLRNTLKMLKRIANEAYLFDLCTAYGVEGSVQGEMASFYIAQDINAMENEGPDGHLPEIYFELLNEYEQRGLKMEEI